jgi:hypothetical protein
MVVYGVKQGLIRKPEPVTLPVDLADRFEAANPIPFNTHICDELIAWLERNSYEHLVSQIWNVASQLSYIVIANRVAAPSLGHLPESFVGHPLANIPLGK